MEGRTRQFLPLSPISRFQLRSSRSPDSLSSSFALPPRSDPRAPLPDIYTTCPELLHFRPIFEEDSRPRAFDPNKSMLRPVDLEFLPKSEWTPSQLSLWDLRQMYFTRRNGLARRFEYKLYNALAITNAFPEAYEFVGAIWVTDRIMKIHARAFAGLLGIHTVQGGLFHKQGNFSRHGLDHLFKITVPEIGKMAECAEVDDYQIRLYTDAQGRFVRGMELELDS
jgi:hypothetical protein